MALSQRANVDPYLRYISMPYRGNHPWVPFAIHEDATGNCGEPSLSSFPLHADNAGGNPYLSYVPEGQNSQKYFPPYSFEHQNHQLSTPPAFPSPSFGCSEVSTSEISSKSDANMSTTAGSSVTNGPKDVISELRSQWSMTGHTVILKQALGLLGGQPVDCIINAIDIEAFEHHPRNITEIGIASLDTREIRKIDPGPSGENWLPYIWIFHFRIKETGHMENRRFVASAPDDFDFGRTKWVSQDEAKEMLKDAFLVDDGKGGKLPVVFLGHALAGDFAFIKSEFDLDLNALGSVVANVDTQVMARMGGLHAQSIGLKDLTYKMGIEPKNLHNAGNDIAYSFLCALFLAFGRPHPYIYRAWQLQPFSKNINEIITDIQQHGKTTWITTWGIDKYCVRCERDNHVRQECRAQVECELCKEHGKKGFRAHLTKRCIRNDVNNPNLPPPPPPKVRLPWIPPWLRAHPFGCGCGCQAYGGYNPVGGYCGYNPYAPYGNNAYGTGTYGVNENHPYGAYIANGNAAYGNGTYTANANAHTATGIGYAANGVYYW